ncbi:hypothetical protein Cgig2_005348 [Carnegiea gigantea]|uniref:Uncharacterized protein n=1 Tax=Carnegiea gigantea TaxID=171969 RepID=A0A9Q1K776_9CARY|nr:hypothetical protein Cgig2_005348 [Carnegiea gigantea]
MSSTYLACKTLSCKIFPDVVPFTLICRGAVHKNGLVLSSSSCLPFPLKGNKDRNHRNRSILLAKFEDRDSEPKDKKDENKEDNRAMEAVLGLYSALKNNDVHGLADQVIEFFTALMGSLGENVQFIVKPTLRDGLGIGVAWKLGDVASLSILSPLTFINLIRSTANPLFISPQKWTHIPLGKGFGFHVCHEYEGKIPPDMQNVNNLSPVNERAYTNMNVEMFMEPLFNMEPLRLVSQLLLSPNKQPLRRTNPHSFFIVQKLISLFTVAIMTIPGCSKLIKELSKANKGIYSPVYGHVPFLSQALPLLKHRRFPIITVISLQCTSTLHSYKGAVGAKAEIDSTKVTEEHRICRVDMGKQRRIGHAKERSKMERKTLEFYR